jgi:hypothetical protein
LYIPLRFSDLEILFAVLVCPMCITRLTHFIRLDLITPIIFGEEYK